MESSGPHIDWDAAISIDWSNMDNASFDNILAGVLTRSSVIPPVEAVELSLALAPALVVD